MENPIETTGFILKPISSIRIFAKIEQFIVTVIQAMIGILLALMVVIVFSNVVARYFLNSSLAWSEEISRFMLIWLAFLGAVMAYVKGEHLGLDVMLKILPRKGAKALQILSNVLVLYALFILLGGGIDLTGSSLSSGWVSPAAGISYGFVYTIVPVSLALFLYFAVIKLIDSVISFSYVVKENN